MIFPHKQKEFSFRRLNSQVKTGIIVFCWFTATVNKKGYKKRESKNNPR